MSEATEKSREVVDRKKWYVLREGTIEAVTFVSGTVRFRVKIGDAGREPFISQWFNDLTPAEDFLERVKEENEAFVRNQLKEEKADGPEDRDNRSLPRNG